MPEYIVFSICLIILSVTGVLKSPCRAVGLSMFEMLYMLLCALALSVFDMTLSVELKVNAGAAVMIFLPALLVEETVRIREGRLRHWCCFSSVIALALSAAALGMVITAFSVRLWRERPPCF